LGEAGAGADVLPVGGGVRGGRKLIASTAGVPGVADSDGSGPCYGKLKVDAVHGKGVLGNNGDVAEGLGGVDGEEEGGGGGV
jgi:hypothetical protein